VGWGLAPIAPIIAQGGGGGSCGIFIRRTRTAAARDRAIPSRKPKKFLLNEIDRKACWRDALTPKKTRQKAARMTATDDDVIASWRDRVGNGKFLNTQRTSSPAYMGVAGHSDVSFSLGYR
jgi:hypothetical protein